MARNTMSTRGGVKDRPIDPGGLPALPQNYGPSARGNPTMTSRSNPTGAPRTTLGANLGGGARSSGTSIFGSSGGASSAGSVLGASPIPGRGGGGGKTNRIFNQALEAPGALGSNSIFSSTVDPQTAMQQVLALQRNVPRINPAQAQAANVTLPGGSVEALQQALVDSRLDPTLNELNRREGQEQEQLRAQLAAAGLSDSGTGIGQQVELGSEFTANRTAAEQQIRAEAAATAQGANIQAAMQTAANNQQVNLANAQLDQQAQTANAANILAGNTAASQAYLSALGIQAQQAQALVGEYLNFFTQQEQLDISRDANRAEAQARMFDLNLKDFALRNDAQNQAIQLGQSQQQIDQNANIAAYNAVNTPGAPINNGAPIGLAGAQQFIQTGQPNQNPGGPLSIYGARR